MVYALVSKTSGHWPVRVRLPPSALGEKEMIEGSWTTSYGGYNGTFTISTGNDTSGGTMHPNLGPVGSTGGIGDTGTIPNGTGNIPIYPNYPNLGPVGPVGSVGDTGPVGHAGAIGPAGYSPIPPSPEMVKAAERLLHDPNFEVGKFLAKVLAKHLEDNIGEYLKDEVVKKYLPK